MSTRSELERMWRRARREEADAARRAEIAEQQMREAEEGILRDRGVLTADHPAEKRTIDKIEEASLTVADGIDSAAQAAAEHVEWAKRAYAAIKERERLAELQNDLAEYEKAGRMKPPKQKKQGWLARAWGKVKAFGRKLWNKGVVLARKAAKATRKLIQFAIETIVAIDELVRALRPIVALVH